MEITYGGFIDRKKKRHAEKYFVRGNTAALALSSKANKHCLCFTHHSSWLFTTFRTATKGFCGGLYFKKALKQISLFNVSPRTILHIIKWMMNKMGICRFLRGQLQKNTEGGKSLQK